GAPAVEKSPPVASKAKAAPRPRVVLPSGAEIVLEMAKTDEERAQGLMFRASLPREAGMIFLFEGLEVRPFWMKNCHFPLDIVHLASDGTVVDVLANIPPCAADPCPTYPPKAAASTVLELNAGAAAANGVVPGAKLTLLEIPGR
ncbi:MAG TPA: DUF192 domain-containing protein, partial [Thermoanaerobaculia bacterium]|nr:DUF192 domain-containing protein [Thermoanaerobaculia bacterium]